MKSIKSDVTEYVTIGKVLSKHRLQIVSIVYNKADHMSEFSSQTALMLEGSMITELYHVTEEVSNNARQKWL